jgi:hypothetical protein
MSDTRPGPPTHRDLWAGIDLKIESASFHLDGMGKALQRPEQTHYNVVLESAGQLSGGNWHITFYAHLDAFLSATRSVPELIRCCFGIDPSQKMQPWFDDLDREERERRREFGDQFKADYEAFRALPLGTARHISEHRTGFAPVTVMVSGRFGIYAGSPIKPIPTSEMQRELPDSNMPPGMEKPIPVQPSWQDFDIDGKPLFETCRDYLDRARFLINAARALAENVHGDSKLTWPSSNM